MMRLWACINMLLRAASQKRKSAQLSRSNTHTHIHTLSLSLSLYVDARASRLRMDHTLS